MKTALKPDLKSKTICISKSYPLFINKLQGLSLEWVGYLSTTGVYGNTQGNWVSEISQPKPFQQRSKYI